MVSFTSDDIAEYYNRNTSRFLGYGQGGSVGAIHRAVWGDGVRTREEAYHYVHHLLLEQIDKIGIGKHRVLDLGCGVGSSLLYLQKHSNIEGFGVTNSKVHLEEAWRRKDKRDFAMNFIRADFCHDTLPADIDFGYGIESFAQGSDARKFFANVSSSLRMGARLALCDDFLATRESGFWLEEFRNGWQLSSLMHREDIDALAVEHDLHLIEEHALTSFLEVDRLRDRAIRVVVALGRPLRLKHPCWLNFLGGNALRQCLKKQLVSYYFRVWTKGSHTGDDEWS